jgi:nucleotide-binding universal stress UspA family protein
MRLNLAAKSVILDLEANEEACNQDVTSMAGYQKLLVATDFSPPADAAVRQGVWLAEQTQVPLVLAHVVSGVSRALLDASSLARTELFQGNVEVFQREIRKSADERLQRLVADLALSGVNVTTETLLGEPFVEIIHAVQQEKYDLVLTGTRGRSGWKRFLVGSTAARLVRKCPSSVWVVRKEPATPPRAILATTDFSAASRLAVEQALWLAGQAGATLYVLHVLDTDDMPEDAFDQLAAGTSRQSLRRQVRGEAQRRLEEFIEQLPTGGVAVEPKLTWGTPWREIVRLARNLSVEVVAMGTVGRSGIEGLLLGNTAEKVLSMCEASILSVKPAHFVSPIEPPFWRLHPAAQSEAPPGSPPT